MAERPILFSPSAVRAILAGTKTQTRRVCKRGELLIRDDLKLPPCRYGVAGDRLWVRETWCRYHDGSIGYLADLPQAAAEKIRWKPSIFLRRADARLRLRVDAVRIERLQDISEHDAKAEGAERADCCHAYYHGFHKLWDSINGEGAWDSNPFVWVITFARELQ